MDDNKYYCTSRNPSSGGMTVSKASSSWCGTNLFCFQLNLIFSCAQWDTCYVYVWLWWRTPDSFRILSPMVIIWLPDIPLTYQIWGSTVCYDVRKRNDNSRNGTIIYCMATSYCNFRSFNRELRKIPLKLVQKWTGEGNLAWGRWRWRCPWYIPLPSS